MNKIKTLIIVMFFIFSFSISFVSNDVNDLSLLGKVIYLDAGHGGVDAGAEAKHAFWVRMRQFRAPLQSADCKDKRKSCR